MKTKETNLINRFLFDFKVDNTRFFSVLITLFCLINILILFPDMYEIYSTNGFISEEINNKHIYPYNPLLSWITNPLEAIGINANITLFLIVLTYIFSLFLILIKYKEFTFSIIAWLIHIMLINSSYYFSYGADYFITFALFINVLFNIKTIINNEKNINILNSFIIRFIQIQLCIVYFFAGFGKILGFDWFDGNAMWYVLHLFSPELSENLFINLISIPLFFKVFGWATLILELLYPILIYNKITRVGTLYAVILMHVGILLFMGLYTFAVILIILNLIAFGHYINFNVSLNKLKYFTPILKKQI